MRQVLLALVAAFVLGVAAILALGLVVLAFVFLSPGEPTPPKAPPLLPGPPAFPLNPFTPSPPTVPRPKPCPGPGPCPRDSGAPVGADEGDEVKHALFVPSEIRKLCRNPDGSCVQCSISMCGYDQNYPEASMLLWDSDYGKAERGGGWPERTSKYAQARGMRCFNITGNEVYDWMKWACATGRGCAIGAGGSHFQTLVGYDPATQTWYVCNNNSTDKIDVYNDAAFRRLHEASGKWVVILDVPPRPARPWQYVDWWTPPIRSAGDGANYPEPRQLH
jgi:hypothetical protein